jgi:hypothetical protein
MPLGASGSLWEPLGASGNGQATKTWKIDLPEGVLPTMGPKCIKSAILSSTIVLGTVKRPKLGKATSRRGASPRGVCMQR